MVPVLVPTWHTIRPVWSGMVVTPGADPGWGPDTVLPGIPVGDPL